jgi:hypothetical protein
LIVYPSVRLDTAYVYTPAIPTSNVVAVLTELKSIGFTDVILSEVREKSGGCSSNTYAWTTGNPSNIGLWLYEANQLGMGVYIGLVFSSGTCGVYHSEPNTSQDAADTANTVLTVVNNYGSAHPALRGWSIVDEAALAYHTDPTILGTIHDYYREQVDAIRLHSALPIITAPYLGGAYTAWDGSVQTPAQVATKAAAFRDATGVDVQVWQDSLGSEMVAFGWSRQPYKVADYYGALMPVLGPSGFWPDVELFTYGNPQFTGPGYTAAPIARVAYSITSAGNTDHKATFLQQYHMGRVVDHVARSDRLMAAYKAWYRIAIGEYAAPESYTWQTQPSVTYPDSGGQLTDLITGDPLSHTDPSWVGISGDARFTLDLGRKRSVRWVGCHVLNMTAQSVRFPDSIQVETSPQDGHWMAHGPYPLGFTRSDGEYVISNDVPLTVDARYIRVTLANSGMTFISEVEVMADRYAPGRPGRPRVGGLVEMT